MKKIITFLLIIIFPIFAYAEDITSSSKITINGSSYEKIKDNNENSYVSINKESELKISNEKDIKGLYVIYELKSVPGVLNANDTLINIGENGFLHEYIDLNKNSSKEISIKYNENVKIGEIYVLSEGELPSYVETWNKPLEKADLLLLSTHSDDEQLFFAGLMPYYVAKGAKVQVVYFTNHNDKPSRLHEQIHGLWTVGITNYPIIGFVPDAWSESLDEAITNLKKAHYTQDDTIKYQVEIIRRFKPQVVVGHDEKGEYSHGQHILNTWALEKALELTNDKSYDEQSANNYGVWDVPKTYLHLYEKNKIVMNYDEPLEYFNGQTAYEMSKKGFSKHSSQQWTWFTKWLTGLDYHGNGTAYTKATEITKYSPLEYGLYRTLVGEDKEKNDMFENLTLLKDQKDKKEDKNIIDVTIERIVNNGGFNYYYLLFGGAFLLLLIIIIHKRKKYK